MGSSGGLLKRDGLAEAFELGDEAFDLAGGVAALVVVAAEVAVDLAGAEHVPVGDEHGVHDGADCPAVAEPLRWRTWLASACAKASQFR